MSQFTLHGVTFKIPYARKGTEAQRAANIHATFNLEVFVENTNWLTIRKMQLCRGKEPPHRYYLRGMTESYEANGATRYVEAVSVLRGFDDRLLRTEFINQVITALNEYFKAAEEAPAEESPVEAS